MSSRQILANAIRFLSMDSVQKAQSGHPGAPMGMADIAEVLWRDFLQHNPENPNWINRDRFVLSNGHGSMLLYSLLHLTGYSLTIDDLKNFRQLHSKTAGHPEYGITVGVETTTGPLGQGLANAVGFAIAEKTLSAQFNRKNHLIIDHHTYAFVGDGCLMEGISHEVCSLAGTLNLGKLIVFYDDNGISIDGSVNGWFTDDTVKRFESYNWQVISSVDGHNSAAISQAIKNAQEETQRPTLICCKTIIGFGSPNKQGKESCHGAPLGDEEIQLIRQKLQWPYPAFEIPTSIYDQWNASKKGKALETSWNQKFNNYQTDYPELAQEFQRRLSGQLPKEFHEHTWQFIKNCQEKSDKIASRKASQNTLEAYGKILPELIGGSADLAGSNLTLWSNSVGIHEKEDGNYIYYGVREFGMSAIMNGLALYGGFIPYGATFLVFMDYARNAIRMAALMKQQAIFVYTHDSIGLGEDGPTHQPIEHLASLRSLPNLHTWRPCDTAESATAWKHAIKTTSTPSALVFSRQSLPCINRTEQQLKDIERGGYILKDCTQKPELIIIATGSEVQLAITAAQQLSDQGKQIRVVSMPSTEVFDAQDVSYQQTVLPIDVLARISIEAAHPDSWYKYVGLDGRTLGISTFGESAPATDLFEYYGLTVNHIIETANELL